MLFITLFASCCPSWTSCRYLVKLAEIYPNVSHARTYSKVAIKLYLFHKERENIDKTRGKEICWVRKSVMQGEGINTPNIHGTPWEPF